MENIDDKISIKKSEYYESNKKIGLIYKRNNYYEPLLYRYYDEREHEIKELFQYGDDTMVDKNIVLIINHLKSIVKDTSPHDFYKYEEIIQEGEDEIIKLYINNYSQVSYIFTRKGLIIPIEPIMIPNGDYKYVYSFKRFPKYEDVIKYLKPFHEYCKISNLNKTDNGTITTILFENGTYLPIQKISENKIKKGVKIEYGLDLYKVENSLYNPVNVDDMKERFINYTKYEEYITKLSFHHMIKVLLSTNEGAIGFTKDHSYYTEGEIGYFTYMKEGKLEYIYKISENEHISYGNHSIYGKVVNVERSGKNKGEITFEIPIIKKIEMILSDKIMIREHKKKKIYDLMNPYISEIFNVISEGEYSIHEMHHYIALCLNKTKNKCRYPCDYYGGCKLQVKEFDIYGNRLIEKIKWKLIEKIIIHGVIGDKIMNIVEDRVNMNDIRKMIHPDEIFYTYSEYKENILEEIFDKKSEYIMNFGSNKEIKRKYHLLKKLDAVPFYINDLFGNDSTVLFHLNNKNNDYLAMEKALNEIGIWYNVKKIKQILKERCTKELLEENKKNGNQYNTIKQLKNAIQGNKYSFTFLDIQNLLEEIKYDESLDTNDIGIFILTQKYTNGKNVVKLFLSNEMNDDIQIISFHHTLYQEDYILSNILVDGEYYSTLGELRKKDNKWNKLKR